MGVQASVSVAGHQVATAVVAEAPPLAMARSPRTHADMAEPLQLSHTLQRSDSWDHSRALSLDNIRQSLIRQVSPMAIRVFMAACMCAKP